MRRGLKAYEGRNVRPWCVALAVLVTAAGLCLGVGTAKAQDVKSYTRATFDEWLSKYKDAKPDFKVGDVLTAKDVERMRPFMFPGYLEQLNFPEFKTTIAAPVDHTPSKDYMACSEKYQCAGKAAAQPYDSQLRLRTALPQWLSRRATRMPDGRPLGITKPMAGLWPVHYSPATWDRFGGTHDIPNVGGCHPPTGGQCRFAEPRVSTQCPGSRGDEDDLWWRRKLPALADAFYVSVSYTHLAMLENHTLAGARRVEFRVQGVHGLLLAV